MLPNVGDKIFIESYKHNGKLHRTWSQATVLESNEDRMVCLTAHTWVSEADGRNWLTREPAICFLYTDKWFNVISMIRKNGIYYYCNIASPSIYDGEAIKNIDYDLDVKVYPNGKSVILDRDEYNHHAKLMNYPDDLKEVLENELDDLLQLIDIKGSPFNDDEVYDLYEKYLSEHK